MKKYLSKYILFKKPKFKFKFLFFSKPLEAIANIQRTILPDKTCQLKLVFIDNEDLQDDEDVVWQTSKHFFNFIFTI